MIIWGSYVLRKTMSRGEFYCQSCECHRDYTLMRPKRWGHLYWIPLIPMDEYDKYVQCGTCQKSYTEAALAFDPIRADEKRDVALAVMASQIMLDFARLRGESPDLDAVKRRVQKLLGLTEFPQGVDSAITVETSSQALLNYIRDHAHNLTPQGQEAVLTAALGSSPSTAELDRARQIGGALGMTSAHVSGTLSSAVGSAPAVSGRAPTSALSAR